jgi:hypothetical protein
MGPFNPRSRLEGWKEIAQHLKKSPRTVQGWEVESGLPIHRIGSGPKAPVYAFAEELDAWLTAGGKPRRVEPPLGSDAVSGPATQATPSRRRWLHYALAGAGAAGVCIGVGTTALQALLRRRRHAVAYRIETPTLIVLDDNSKELWRHTFPEPMFQLAYKDLFRCVFADLDGDGRVSTLFPFLPDNHSSDCQVFCFNSNGAVRWQFIPGKKVIDNLGREFVPPFWANSIDLIHVRGSSNTRVVISSNHHWSFPNQVAVLDGKTGRLVGEYWHRGHLSHMVVVDIDDDGIPEILLGGVNDAPDYKQATLVILDGRRVRGCTLDRQGIPYFRGIEAGAERSIIYFPRTPISKDAEFNITIELRVALGRITIIVAEGISKIEPNVVYELDYHMHVISVTLSDQLQNRYKELQTLGTLPIESSDVITERLKSQVKVLQVSAE